MTNAETTSSSTVKKNVYLLCWKQNIPKYGPEQQTGEFIHPLYQFESQIVAEAHLREMQSEGFVPPQHLNPFRYYAEMDISEQKRTSGSMGYELSDVTSFPEPIFSDWLLEAGINPTLPTLDPWYSAYPLRSWVAWYDNLAPTLTETQIRKIWKVLDKINHIVIEEIEVEE
ncbi:MAG: hypothetical protein ACFCD0_24380 [Gemmataceae bacterium]